MNPGKTPTPARRVEVSAPLPALPCAGAGPGQGAVRVARAGTSVRRSRLGLTVVAAACMTLNTGSVCGQTLADFGYGLMTRNGEPAIGPHPLLLILATVSNQPALLHDDVYYHNLVFSTNAGVRSLNNYLLENSNGRFRWVHVAAPPLHVAIATNYAMDALVQYMEDQGLTNTVYGEHWASCTWFSNVISRTYAQTGFNFEAFNNNPEDDVLSNAELAILVLSNDPGSPGLGRAPNAKIEGTALRTGGVIAGAMECEGAEMGFNVFCHEATHILGPTDLYGAEECFLSRNLSLYCDKFMGDPGDLRPNITGNRHEIYHMDPWHKLRLGWIEPPIRSLGADGSVTLYPPQSGRTNACAIFYDPAHGPLEYLIAEYRAYNTSWGAGYDTNVAANGVVVWHVQHDPDLSLGRTLCRCGYCTYGAHMNKTVYTEGASYLKFGGWVPWGGDSEIPSPSFLDPSASEPKLFPARFHVAPFSDGAASVTLSWKHIDWVWVDFAHSGVESGTFTEPFNTLAEGVAATPSGGTVCIKGGNTPETPGITKQVRIMSYGGDAAIGR